MADTANIAAGADIAMNKFHIALRNRHMSKDSDPAALSPANGAWIVLSSHIRPSCTRPRSPRFPRGIPRRCRLHPMHTASGLG